MKKTILFFTMMLAVTAFGCRATNEKGNAGNEKAVGATMADDGYVPSRSDYTFRTEVKTTEEDGSVMWDTIVVYVTDARRHTTELYSQALPLDTATWSQGQIGEITEEDWNFDGIPDLQVCTGPMNSYGNLTYDVWLWDDKAHKFLRLELEEEMFDPQVDISEQCIVSIWRLDDEVEVVKYKWKEGKFVESERETFSYSSMTED